MQYECDTVCSALSALLCNEVITDNNGLLGGKEAPITITLGEIERPWATPCELLASMTPSSDPCVGLFANDAISLYVWCNVWYKVVCRKF